MNVCTEGNCICDAAEWEGDTHCDAYYGIKKPVETPVDRVTGPPAYYLDHALSPGRPVVISVDPAERKPGVSYFKDPKLTEAYE